MKGEAEERRREKREIKKGAEDEEGEKKQGVKRKASGG